MSDSNPGPVRLARPRDYVLVIVFLYLWLIPVVYVSVANRSMPLAPAYLKHLHAVSCLFNHRPARWQDHYFQVRLQGSTRWINPVETDYFRLQPFGHRNRMHQMFRAPHWHGPRQLQGLAEFVKHRFERLHPDGPPVESVRVVSASYVTGEPAMARPEGRWRKRPLEQVESRRLTVRSTHFFDGRPPQPGN